mmetsp:Transcript_18094/g.27954  ORF Transcript_18094/g.27954 Transcript_18094/m.27954 type:complete len:391 (-) Transcript_18094:600-1772(-)
MDFRLCSRAPRTSIFFSSAMWQPPTVNASYIGQCAGTANEKARTCHEHAACCHQLSGRPTGRHPQMHQKPAGKDRDGGPDQAGIACHAQNSEQDGRAQRVAQIAGLRDSTISLRLLCRAVVQLRNGGKAGPLHQTQSAGQCDARRRIARHHQQPDQRADTERKAPLHHPNRRYVAQRKDPNGHRRQDRRQWHRTQHPGPPVRRDVRRQDRQDGQKAERIEQPPCPRCGDARRAIDCDVIRQDPAECQAPHCRNRQRAQRGTQYNRKGGHPDRMGDEQRGNAICINQWQAKRHEQGKCHAKKCAPQGQRQAAIPFRAELCDQGRRGYDDGQMRHALDHAGRQHPVERRKQGLHQRHACPDPQRPQERATVLDTRNHKTRDHAKKDADQSDQ